MFFVPMPPVPQQPLNPRTRELAELLGRVLEEYEKHHPAVTAQEVRQALEMAAGRSRRGSRVALQLTLYAGLAALLGAGVLAWFLMDAGSMNPEAAPMVVASVVLALLVGLFVVLARRMG